MYLFLVANRIAWTAIFLCTASLASSKELYPPESWVMTVKFLNFPYEIDCVEERNRGKVTKSRQTYKITGFPDADRLICTVPNGRSFVINMKFMFGVGRTKRVMGGEFFEGEIRRIDLKVKHEVHQAYKAHVRLKTIFGKERVPFFTSDMQKAFFPEQTDLPTRRWKKN